MKSILKNSLLMLAVAVVAVAQSSDATAQNFNPPASNNANAVLDLSTGEVTLNLGADLQVLGLETTDGANIFDTAAFDASTGLGAAQQLDPNGIGFLSLSAISPGTFNLGAILDPSVRSEAALETFQFRFGIAGQPANIANLANGGVTVTAIPEPGSLSLLALAGFGVVARRRR